MTRVPGQIEFPTVGVTIAFDMTLPLLALGNLRKLIL